MIKMPAVGVRERLAALAWGCLILVNTAHAQQNRPNRPEPVVPAAGNQVEKPGALTNRPEDEKAIRGVADAFARAFAAGDSRSIAAMFSDDAELIDETGEKVLGRASIEEYYHALFQARPQSTIEIAIDSLRFLSPDVAKEEGHTRVKSSDEAATLRRYTVLYIKTDGRWLYSSAREEHAATVAHHEQLKPLEWLLGEWVDQSSDSTVHASCRWSPDKNFLLRDFTVHVQGQPAMSIAERIGWDPLTRQIKSWVFDSRGGYGDALWTRQGNQWVIKSTGVLPDGRTASATHILAVTGPNSARMSSTERTIGEHTIAEPAEYTMVRRAPVPQAVRTP